MSVSNEAGEDITPPSAKACGLIALLATSPEMRRPRRWIEDKLWSDRGPEQAGASLRQTLSQLRRTYKNNPEFIHIDRKVVSLNNALVATDLEENQKYGGEGAHHFLEGLDIRDPAFESWLRETRASYEQKPDPALQSPQAQTGTPLTLRCVSTGPGSEMATFLAQIATSQVAQNICEQTGAHCFSEATPAEEVDIEVNCSVVEHPKSRSVFIKVTLTKSGLVLHSKAVEVSNDTVDFLNNDTLARALFDASEQVLRKIPRYHAYLAAGQYGPMLVQQAISGLFSFEKEALKQADHQFTLAYNHEKNPAVLAWRGLVRNIQAIEMPHRDLALLKQEAKLLLDESLVLDADNSLIMSLAALTRVMLFDDAEGAMDLARPAMESNPNSAFALQSISMAHMISGNKKSAYLISQRAHNIAATSKYGYWWDLFHCLACISTKRFNEAMPLAYSAARRAPGFRPPLRALIALHGFKGEANEAKKAAARLSRIENQFSMQRFFEDATYPNNTVRAAGLLNMPRASLIELQA